MVLPDHFIRNIKIFVANQAIAVIPGCIQMVPIPVDFNKVPHMQHSLEVPLTSVLSSPHSSVRTASLAHSLCTRPFHQPKRHIAYMLSNSPVRRCLSIIRAARRKRIKQIQFPVKFRHLPPVTRQKSLAEPGLTPPSFCRILPPIHKNRVVLSSYHRDKHNGTGLPAKTLPDFRFEKAETTI